MSCTSSWDTWNKTNLHCYYGDHMHTETDAITVDSRGRFEFYCTGGCVVIASCVTCISHFVCRSLCWGVQVTMAKVKQVGLLAAGCQPWNKDVCAASGDRFAYCATLAIYIYQVFVCVCVCFSHYMSCACPF